MENMHVSKNPTLEVISETEPQHSRRANYSNPTQIAAESNVYKVSINRHDGSNFNQAYNGSQGFNGNSQSTINRDGSIPSVRGVYREQYWVCSQPLRCRNWTRRERILFFVLLGLSTVVLGLVAVISFISRSSKNNTDTPPSWFPWL